MSIARIPCCSILGRHRTSLLRSNFMLTRRKMSLNQLPSLTDEIDDPQQSCGFFLLPAEIRFTIYELAYGNLYIQIEQNDGPPIVNRKRKVHSLRSHSYDLQAKLETDAICHTFCRALRLPGRTCRRIYEETAVLHLKLNVFTFENESFMRKWMIQLTDVQRRALRRIEVTSSMGLSVPLIKELTGLHLILTCGIWMKPRLILEIMSLMHRDKRSNSVRPRAWDW